LIAVCFVVALRQRDDLETSWRILSMLAARVTKMSSQYLVLFYAEKSTCSHALRTGAVLTVCVAVS
jgi:hypothetical protein